MTTVDISTLEKLDAFSKEFMISVESPSVLLLNGDLSSGKTQFVKCSLAHLGLKESEVSSPSYSIINKYIIEGKVIYHIDLYRLESEEELEQIGFWDLFESEFSYIFVEWANKFSVRTSHKTTVLEFVKASQNKRSLSVVGDN